jgi:DNA gyrase/topoisomerase IV subunit B
MLTVEQENFFRIVEIEEISDTSEVMNCIDFSVEDDESFVLDNGIISHNSAMGSILQKRDPKRDGVYALKGKIKNARSLSDLSDNREILELMQILNLDPEGQNLVCPFEKVVIATDQDPDGAK